MLQQHHHISKLQAKKTAKNLVKQAKKNLSKNTYLPKNYGEYLLKNESKDAWINDFLAKKRAEGVRDEDIRWLWNMNNLEREALAEWGQYNITVTYSKFIRWFEQGGSIKKTEKSTPNLWCRCT